MTCPKCYSSNVVHKDKDKDYHQLNHRAKHHAGHGLVHAAQGHPASLVVVGGLWAVYKAVHALSHTYTCQNPNCGHRFS